MKKLLLLSSLSLLLAVTSQAQKSYTLMTCNIRITGLDADAPYPERTWEGRRELCVNTILKRKPDVFCLQEVIYDSYAYFKEHCKDYVAFGFEGPEMYSFSTGYHGIGKNVIFYRRDRFNVEGAGCYWLSEQPLIGGSMSWGTTRARHCNWLRLRDKRSGKEMRILDVHLDHKVDSARRNQIKMVLEECSQYADNFPQIICGDFNAGITSAPIKYIRTQEGWREMYETVHGLKEAGYSYHAFMGTEYKPSKPKRRIDFIFYRGNIEVEDAQYVKDHQGKVWPSDHYFIETKFNIK